MPKRVRLRLLKKLPRHSWLELKKKKISKENLVYQS